MSRPVYLIKNRQEHVKEWENEAGSIKTLRNLDFLYTFRRVLKNIIYLCKQHIIIVIIIGREKEIGQLHEAYNDEYSWFVRKTEERPGAQIDLLLDRSDETINICEIKYTSSGEYTVTEEEEQKVLNRRERFLEDTQTTKAIHLTLITTHGLTRNAHADIFQNVVTAESFFE